MSPQESGGGVLQVFGWAIKSLAHAARDHDFGLRAATSRTSGVSAEALAAYITAIINQQQRRQDLLQDAMHALKQVLDEGVNFSSEQSAEHAIDNIKKVIS